MAKKKAVKTKLRKGTRKTPVIEIAPEEQIVGAIFLGKVTEFDARRCLIRVELEDGLANGDTIRIKGHITDLTQKVERLQIKGQKTQSASAGETVDVQVAHRSRVGDAVYKL
ncbi:MAG: translation elongation factor-like protein [Elusimicrobia bacterium]|nr:translation elongation factor-like protein [Elusimicrobiota bacterium]